MRRFLVLAALAAVSAPGIAQSQVKYPIFDDSKSNVRDVVFAEATKRSDFQNGKLLRVTLDSGATVQGFLVRTDPAKKMIYVRTEPRTLPRGIAVNDAKRIETGTIKQVSDRGEAPGPEIQQLVINNGGKRRIAYFGPTLSPSELSALDELERAENDLSHVEYLAAVEQRVLLTDAAMQGEQLKTRELANQILSQQLYYNTNLRYFFEGGVRGWEANRGPAAIAEAIPALMFGDVSPVPFLRLGATVFPKLPLGNEPLAQARRNYQTAQSHAVFENGRLVAMVVSEPIAK